MKRKFIFNKVVINLELESKEYNYPKRNYDTLEEIDIGYIVSICGEVYKDSNKIDMNIVTAGQCLEECLHEVLNNPKDSKENKELMRKIYSLWQEYHLNDLRAGTKTQTEFIRLHCKDMDYTQIKEKLKEVGLYEDRGYKYGTAWLIQAIPEKAIKEIINL